MQAPESAYSLRSSGVMGSWRGSSHRGGIVAWSRHGGTRLRLVPTTGRLLRAGLVTG